MKSGQDKSLREKIFSRLFWDYPISPSQVEEILSSNQEREKEKIYLRLLMSSAWYDLLKILSHTELKEALTENVISKIQIPSLRKKYEYARRIL